MNGRINHPTPVSIPHRKFKNDGKAELAVAQKKFPSLIGSLKTTCKLISLLE